jgi:hypothetical protein
MAYLLTLGLLTSSHARELHPSAPRGAEPHEISDALERGAIVAFPECPLALPSAEDLAFLRDGGCRGSST